MRAVTVPLGDTVSFSLAGAHQGAASRCPGPEDKSRFADDSLMRNFMRSYLPDPRHLHHGLVALAAACIIVTDTACVSRNVERISAEEGASIAPPPEPNSEAERAASAAQMPAIDGTVTMAVDLAGPAPPGVLYVIVRVAGRAQGPPLAVKQLAGELPAAFRISEADAMIPGTPFVGDLDVIVRLDQDGNAFSRQDGDLEGRAGPVQVGGSVQIVLYPTATAEADSAGAR